MTESKQPDQLEADVRKLHACLAELLSLQAVGKVWVDAKVLARELERMLAKNKRRPGEGPGPAQNKDTILILTERGEMCNGKNSTDHSGQ